MMLASAIGFAVVLTLALLGVPLGFSLILVGVVGFSPCAPASSKRA